MGKKRKRGQWEVHQRSQQSQARRGDSPSPALGGQMVRDRGSLDPCLPSRKVWIY